MIKEKELDVRYNALEPDNMQQPSP